MNQFDNPEEQQDWDRIKTEWPILRGADTLLGLQAILRLLVVLCAAVKARMGQLTPLSGMAGVCTFAAMSLRSALAAQNLRYDLDGPLGGRVAMGVEAAMVALLATLVCKTFWDFPLRAAVVITAAWSFASSHYFNFAMNPRVDGMFTAAHVLEGLAAVWFLAQSMRSACRLGKGECNAASGFAYLMMPLQQSLSTYYFFNVRELHDSSIVGAGHPLCLIKYFALLQLVAYFVAAAFHLAERLDNSTPFLDIEGGSNIEAHEIANVRTVWQRTSDYLKECQTCLPMTAKPLQIVDL